MYYSQDDYDGILPAVETERVGLAEDDTTLMWKLFDFAQMSAQSRSSPDHVLSPTTEKTPNVSSTIEPRLDHTSDARERLRSVSGVSQNVPRPVNNTQNFGGVPDENLDTSDLNLSLFDQLPEDWVFTIDDWTLFGAPGSTYFYNEGT